MKYRPIQCIQYHLKEADTLFVVKMTSPEMRAWEVRFARAQREYHLARVKALVDCLFDVYCDYLAGA